MLPVLSSSSLSPSHPRTAQQGSINRTELYSRLSTMASLSILRLSKKTLVSSSPLVLPLQRLLSTTTTTSPSPSPASPPPPISNPVSVDPDRVKWDYRGQRGVIPLGQWVPKIAVDAYVAPNVVLAGQVKVHDGASVWGGSVLRGDLNKITIGFCSNIQEKCVLHASWSTSTGRWISDLILFDKILQLIDAFVVRTKPHILMIYSTCSVCNVLVS